AGEEGRIAYLLCAADRALWADPDAPGQPHAARQPGDLDVIDVASTETLQHGGEVRFVESSAMPTDGSPLAAVLRKP
ncbi:MAG: hypothetical protein ACO4CZ_19230, partial [Planctomycetota bacterium]